MSLATHPRFLRTVLWADAASCAGTGLLQLLATPLLASWFGLPASLLTVTGLALLAVALFAAILASRRVPPRAGVWIMVAGNLAWLLGCLELLFAGHGVSTLGYAWIAVQAVVVGVLAELEWLAIRRAPAAAWA
jgi:Na+/melibiose symporter-like transporter